MLVSQERDTFRRLTRSECVGCFSISADEGLTVRRHDPDLGQPARDEAPQMLDGYF
jgi:hypothetical protein